MHSVSATAEQQVFSRDEARRIFSVSERQLRSWERQGLLSEREHFNLTDLVALRTLVGLRKSGVPPAKVKRAVLALRDKIQNISDPLTQLRIYSEGSRIRVDIEGGTMEPVSGQLLLNFGPADLKKLLSFPSARPQSDDERRQKQRAEAELLFEKGLEMEQTGAPVADIVTLYQHAVQLDNRCTGALVNLGTIYFNARQFDKAEELYKQAIEADPQYALAHFNLANLCDERGRRAQALEHYRIAIELNAQYGDAHYNLALLYQTMGETMNAVRHWQSYLRIDPGSSWSAIARKELEKLKNATIVRGRA
jgi:tetratricopeptide (TPR) repeat protein